MRRTRWRRAVCVQAAVSQIQVVPSASPIRVPKLRSAFQAETISFPSRIERRAGRPPNVLLCPEERSIVQPIFGDPIIGGKVADDYGKGEHCESGKDQRRPPCAGLVRNDVRDYGKPCEEEKAKRSHDQRAGRVIQPASIRGWPNPEATLPEPAHDQGHHDAP
jgi:hypothetical protein